MKRPEKVTKDRSSKKKDTQEMLKEDLTPQQKCSQLRKLTIVSNPLFSRWRGKK